MRSGEGLLLFCGIFFAISNGLVSRILGMTIL